MLLVEGELDAQVLAFLSRTGVGVEKGGSKSSLPPKAREQRKKTGATVWYLRDRDFDYDPPSQSGQLSVDKRDGEEVLGWRWCRHSIESYLLDPQVVEAAMGWQSDEYSEKLRDAGRKIAGYTAVRWALGRARMKITGVKHPASKVWKAGKKADFWLPTDLSLAANKAEGLARIQEWREAMAAADQGHMDESVDRQCEDLKGLTQPEDVLTWHAGKDLFTALTPQRLGGRTIDAGGLCTRLRDWIRDHPDEALSFFPEWADLCEQVKAS